MEPMTERQLNFLAFHLWQNGYKGDAMSIKKLKDNVDKGTAMDVIGMFKKGQVEMGLNQLRHLNAI